MDPKPKENCASSSSTTTPPPPEKKTRDRPNLSDCHSCGCRINHTNPEDRLQPLDSVWRIVLVCRRCRKNIRSGKTCSYCFKETENSGNIVQCKLCEVKIHEDCVRVYGNCTPWCYLGAGLGRFKVCVDCWVPDPLKSSIQVSSRKNESNNAVCKGDTMDKLMKGVKYHVKKKVRVKGQSLKKNVVNLKADRKKDGRKGGNYDRGDAVERRCDGNMEIMRSRNWKGLSYKRNGYCGSQRKVINWSEGDDDSCSDVNGLKSRLLTYKRDKNRKIWQMQTISDDDARTGCNGSSSDFDGLKLILLTYKRDKSRKLWHVNDESPMALESSSSQQDELNLKLHLDDASTSCDGPCSDINGSRQLLLTFKRNKKRKAWGMDNENTPLFELKLESHLDRVHSNGSGSRTDVVRFIPEALICGVDDQTISNTNVDRFGKTPVTYKRTRFRQNVVEDSGGCSSSDNYRVAYVPEYWQPDDAENRTGCLVTCEAHMKSPNRSYDMEKDRYHLKYGKRATGTKSSLSSLSPNTSLSENRESEPALSVMLLNVKRGLILPDGRSE